jgi:carboxylesterase
MIIPGAEPFYFSRGKTGCLLVHGFTGTPREMRGMGEYLAAHGKTAAGIRLTGHATQPEDMIRARWKDWLASVEDGWHLLSEATERIFIIGLSMGGVLALSFASCYPVAGVVAISTPHHLPQDPRLHFVKLLSWFKPFFPKGQPDWHDLEAYRHHISYPSDPTRAYAELRDLMVEMRSGLPKVSAPVLLINSKGDQTVKAEDNHMEAIYAELGSQHKSALWVENSGHVITCDQERERVFQAVDNFIDSVNQGLR